ncbi:MAG: hypothetical protein ACK4RK_04750 [Gemmataceae bacterium]
MRFRSPLVWLGVMATGFGWRVVWAEWPSDFTEPEPIAAVLEHPNFFNPHAPPVLLEADSLEQELWEWSPERMSATGLRHQVDLPWATVSARWELTDQRAESQRNATLKGWRTEESWQIPVLARLPLTLYGNVGVRSLDGSVMDMRMFGATGLKCTVASLLRGEMVVSGGPMLPAIDPWQIQRDQDRPDWIVEIQYRQPIIHQIKLEYSGLAKPTWTDSERAPLQQFNQDIRLAFPVGDTGQFRLGARYDWQNASEPRPWMDNMQVYLGFTLRR